MSKIIRLLRDLKEDYKTSYIITKRNKRKCYKQAAWNLLMYIWGIITAPLIYPIWYIARGLITENAEKNKAYHWLWTYGDLHDPLGRGGMPEDYRDGKNSFINRYWYSAIRNPRFTYNYENFMSRKITHETSVIDTRDYSNMIKSYGVGDSPEGRIFKWFMDREGDYYFIYENNTIDSVFWLGWVGLLTWPLGKQGRFEIAYRINKT